VKSGSEPDFREPPSSERFSGGLDFQRISPFLDRLFVDPKRRDRFSGRKRGAEAFAFGRRRLEEIGL